MGEISRDQALVPEEGAKLGGGDKALEVAKSVVVFRDEMPFDNSSLGVRTSSSGGFYVEESGGAYVEESGGPSNFDWTDASFVSGEC